MAGVPADAGAFLAMDGAARHAVLAQKEPPSIVAAVGAAGIRAASVPVVRAGRPSGRSAWTGRARLRQSTRTLVWALRART